MTLVIVGLFTTTDATSPFLGDISALCSLPAVPALQGLVNLWWWLSLRRATEQEMPTCHFFYSG